MGFFVSFFIVLCDQTQDFLFLRNKYTYKHLQA